MALLDVHKVKAELKSQAGGCDILIFESLQIFVVKNRLVPIDRLTSSLIDKVHGSSSGS